VARRCVTHGALAGGDDPHERRDHRGQEIRVRSSFIVYFVRDEQNDAFFIGRALHPILNLCHMRSTSAVGSQHRSSNFFRTQRCFTNPIAVRWRLHRCTKHSIVLTHPHGEQCVFHTHY
jgi:hypothetical protein